MGAGGTVAVAFELPNGSVLGAALSGTMMLGTTVSEDV